MRKIIIIICSISILLAACGTPAAVPNMQYAVLLSGNVLATMPAGTAAFTITAQTGVVSITGVSMYELVGATFAPMLPITLATALAAWQADGGMQRLVEGNPAVTVNGIRYTSLPGGSTTWTEDGIEYIAHANGDLDVRVVNPDVAQQAAAQVALELDVSLPGSQTQAMDTQNTNTVQATPSKENRGDAAIVTLDDDPVDLAAMTTAATTVMKYIGYQNVTAYACLNDWDCVTNGALRGGPGGKQAVCVFFDGGLVGMQIPEGSPYPPFPPIPAKTVKGKSFFSGPWAATYLRQLGYTGCVIYVSTEGWGTIGQFKGQGAELGPTFEKGWFFPKSTNFADRILNAILYPR